VQAETIEPASLKLPIWQFHRNASLQIYATMERTVFTVEI